MKNAALTSEARLQRLARIVPLYRGKSGQAVVETALALPAFVLLLFGSIQYSIALCTYCNATYACRNAARYASMRSSSSISPATTTQIKSVVTSSLFLNSAITPTVGVTYLTPALGTGSNTVGNFVEVSVSWNQTMLIPFNGNKSVSIGTQVYRTISR